MTRQCSGPSRRVRFWWFESRRGAGSAADRPYVILGHLQRPNTVGILNPFNLTVWATPLIVGFAMGQSLRRKMRPIVRAAMWIAYFAWAWGWISIWYMINSGGSGRFAVAQLIFDWGVKGTTLLGLLALVSAEFARRRGSAAG